MGRIWVIALGIILATWVLFALGDIGGKTLLLTASAPLGAGVVAAFLVGGSYFSRAIWLLVGVIAGSLGYAFSALFATDNTFGIAMTATFVTLVVAILTFWTRKESAFLCGVLGVGSITAVYTYSFNLDPQSINVSLPIGMGMTILPMSFGYLVGMLTRILLPDDQEYQEIRAAEHPNDGPSDDAVEPEEATDAADSTESAEAEPSQQTEPTEELEKNASNA
jgi:hypothetical protein